MMRPLVLTCSFIHVHVHVHLPVLLSREARTPTGLVKTSSLAMADACKGRESLSLLLHPLEWKRPSASLSPEAQNLHSMLPTMWYWDKGSASADVNDYCPYPAEISKKIEECYVRYGPGRFMCDVGGGRVVTKTRNGLVQHVAGEPGRWRAVRRVEPVPDATRRPAILVTAAAAKPTAQPPASAPAMPPLTGQASTNTWQEKLRFLHAMGADDDADFSAGRFARPLAAAPAAGNLRSDGPLSSFLTDSPVELPGRTHAVASDSSAIEPPTLFPMFTHRSVTPPPPQRAAGMQEPRSASPARNGKMRDEDSCSDEEQPPPAKHSRKAALKQAVLKANGKWPRMSTALEWGPRALEGEYRNDFGEIDGDGLWRYKVNNGRSSKWIRDRKSVSRGLSDGEQGLISMGTRKPSNPEVKRAWEEHHEEMVGGRRESRGVGGGWAGEACVEILEARHVIAISLAHPQHGPFVWPSVDEASMAPQREAVVARIDDNFGPMLPVSRLTRSIPNVNSLLTLISAFEKNERIMIVDTECHRHDDTAPDPRWKAREVYDLAIACTDWDGKVVQSQRWLERHGRLSDADLEEARDYLAARPSLLVCCWGSPEFDFFRAARRKAADGSDGFDVREAILQVLPGMRHLASADVTRRFSLSMNLLTPLFGLRHAPYHTALADCEGEAVVITAFIRYISRSQRMPPPPPAATWDADDDDVFE